MGSLVDREKNVKERDREGEGFIIYDWGWATKKELGNAGNDSNRMTTKVLQTRTIYQEEEAKIEQTTYHSFI